MLTYIKKLVSSTPSRKENFMDSKEQILHKKQIVDLETDCKFSTLIEPKTVEISLNEECSKDTVLISSGFDMLIG